MVTEYISVFDTRTKQNQSIKTDKDHIGNRNIGIGNIKFAKVLSDGNLLVGCNEEKANKALKLKKIGGIKVVSTNRIGEKNKSRGRKGIIFGVPLHISMEEFKGNLKGGKIVNAQRIKSGVNGNRNDTKTSNRISRGGNSKKNDVLGKGLGMLLQDVGNSVYVLIVEETMNMASVRREFKRSFVIVKMLTLQPSEDIKY